MCVEEERARRCDDGWVPGLRTRKASIERAVYWLASEHNRAAGVDWRNRRNGSLRMVIDLEQCTLELTVRTRLTGPVAFRRRTDIETGREAEPASSNAA